MKINAEEIRNKLTDNDIIKIVNALGGQVKQENEQHIIFDSICHHLDADRHKPKLYYYKEEKFFLCYSCSSSGDIFWLVQKRKELLGEKLNFPQCIKFVCKIVGIDCNNIKMPRNTFDWSDLKRYLPNNRDIKLNKVYDTHILDCLESKYHQSFIDDHISIKTMQKYRLKYYDLCQQVCIPVFDDESNFVGVHCRNFLPYYLEQDYKYLPLKILDGTEYKFNTSNLLYGLNLNKMFIQNSKTVIITEAPKGVMQLDSYGVNLGVGLFGRALQKQKRDLLLKYNVEKIYIALDKQYHLCYNEQGQETEEFTKYKDVVIKIVDTLRPYVQEIWIIYDNDEDNMLDYCDSPMDKGQDVWQYLFNSAERVV